MLNTSFSNKTVGVPDSNRFAAPLIHHVWVANLSNQAYSVPLIHHVRAANLSDHAYLVREYKDDGVEANLSNRRENEKLVMEWSRRLMEWRERLIEWRGRLMK